MTALLEIREKIKKIYNKNEMYIIPVIKFFIALVMLLVLNGKLGYMTKIDNFVIVLVVALLCSFLPSGAMVAFGTLFSLAHMYALSLEVALFGVCVYMVLFIMFIRFSPKEILVVAITPLLCCIKIPYIMPIAMGLLGTPVSAVSVGCGVIIYYLFEAIIGSASTINAMGSEDALGKVRLLIDAFVGNKAMIITVVAFAVTVVVVYIVRRMAVDYSWSIAIIAGALLNLMILLVGDLMYDTNLSVGIAILGSLVAMALAKCIEFMRFCVDYSRTEKVQFEDDEYYYYVKAVPKMNLAEQNTTVKKINTQTKNSRAVSTERQKAASQTKRVARPSQRSMTINSVDESASNEFFDDYEDIF